MERALGAGDGDVGQAAFLGLGALAHGATVGEQALLGAGDPDVVELEALGAVDGQHARRLASGRGESLAASVELGEEVAEVGTPARRLVGAREAHELAQVAVERRRALARAVRCGCSGRCAAGARAGRRRRGRRRRGADAPGRALDPLATRPASGRHSVAHRGRAGGAAGASDVARAVLEQRPLRMRVGVGEERAARAAPDAAPAAAGDAREGQPVARVGDQGEGGERVADLGAVREPGGAGDGHRDAGGRAAPARCRRELVDAHERTAPTAGRAGRPAPTRRSVAPPRRSSSQPSTAHRVPAGPVVHRRLPRGRGGCGESGWRREDGGGRAVVALQGDVARRGSRREGGEVLLAGGAAVGADGLVGVAEDGQAICAYRSATSDGELRRPGRRLPRRAPRQPRAQPPLDRRDPRRRQPPRPGPPAAARRRPVDDGGDGSAGEGRALRRRRRGDRADHRLGAGRPARLDAGRPRPHERAARAGRAGAARRRRPRWSSSARPPSPSGPGSATPSPP